MNYNLKKPCANCPFRTDKRFFLSPERAEEIGNSIIRQQLDFPCHKTTKHGEEDEDGYSELQAVKSSEMCAGAMIMAEYMNKPTQMMRIAERLGMYDHNKLDMESPVFTHVDEFIEAAYETESI